MCAQKERITTTTTTNKSWKKLNVKDEKIWQNLRARRNTLWLLDALSLSQSLCVACCLSLFLVLWHVMGSSHTHTHPHWHTHNVPATQSAFCVCCFCLVLALVLLPCFRVGWIPSLSPLLSSPLSLPSTLSLLLLLHFSWPSRAWRLPLDDDAFN